MKRFQLGLKREARPQRYGGEELDWGLQITNEKSNGIQVPSKKRKIKNFDQKLK